MTDVHPVKRLSQIHDLDGPVPDYDELPRIDALESNHCWGLFGDGDELGLLNLLTPARRRAALAAVREGVTVNLSLPLDEPKPALGEFRKTYRHHVYRINRNSIDEYVDGLYTQGSSQWDGLRHVSAREFGSYNGFDVNHAEGDEIEGLQGKPYTLGIDRWAARGIVGRGVLLDYVGYVRQSTGRDPNPFECARLTPEILERIANWENVRIEPGDLLLLRTGWVEQIMAHEPEDRKQFVDTAAWIGLESGENMARFLWNKHVIGVAADNRAVEAAPGDPKAGFLHRRLIPLMGMMLGELWELSALARECERQRRYDVLVVSVPLNLPEGTGSPANAIAII
jgi:kynurenine formamidase